MSSDPIRDESGTTNRRATAESMAAKQRDISVSEFFTKNRHLLGFDNPQKALLTAVKEAVDNSLDACEEAGIPPTLRVQIEELSEGRFRVTVEDNGPGIVKAQIPKIFAKLLYGSKFHRLKQSRGQQGIGISAAGMYGQLTTGRPIIITSKIGKGRPAYRLEVRIDARSNAPEILKDEVVPWEKDHGTMVSIEMSGLYRAGRASVATYLEQTVVANPHLELVFQPPKGETVTFPRASETMPPETQEIKPHPYGVELGMLIKNFQEAGDRTARQVLMEDFSRVTAPVANELLRKSGVDPNAPANRMDGPHIEAIHRVIQVSQATLPPVPRLFKTLQKRDDKFTTAIQELGTNFTPSLVEDLAKRAGFAATAAGRSVEMTQLDRFVTALENLQVRILPPPATCVAPIGEPLMIEGLKRRFKADFFASHTRPPAVYRGNPFVVEVGIAFGGDLPKDESAEVLRFANRVPLLYQPRACATTEAVVRVNWKSYGREGGLNQRGSELPVGPLAVLVHLASVWVPFTNEAKEAIANYDEIVEEIRLALMECGRKLGTWVGAQQAQKWQEERKSLFEKYIEELSTSMGTITGIGRDKIRGDLLAALPRHVKLDAPASAPPGPGSNAPPAAPGASAEVHVPPLAAPPQLDVGDVAMDDTDGDEPAFAPRSGRKARGEAAGAEPAAEGAKGRATRAEGGEKRARPGREHDRDIDAPSARGAITPAGRGAAEPTVARGRAGEAHARDSRPSARASAVRGATASDEEEPASPKKGAGRGANADHGSTRAKPGAHAAASAPKSAQPSVKGAVGSSPSKPSSPKAPVATSKAPPAKASSKSASTVKPSTTIAAPAKPAPAKTGSGRASPVAPASAKPSSAKPSAPKPSPSKSAPASRPLAAKPSSARPAPVKASPAKASPVAAARQGKPWPGASAHRGTAPVSTPKVKPAPSRLASPQKVMRVVRAAKPAAQPPQRANSARPARPAPAPASKRASARPKPAPAARASTPRATPAPRSPRRR